MRWFHQLVRRHRVHYVIQEPVVLAHGMRPRRWIYTCSCGRVWTRRSRQYA